MDVSSRRFVVGFLPAVILLIATVSLPAQAQEGGYVYAITDVRLTKSEAAFEETASNEALWSQNKEYTGVNRWHVTVPYVPGDPAARGPRWAVTSVNSGLKGDRVGI